MWKLIQKDYHWFIINSKNEIIVYADRFVDYAKIICEKHNNEIGELNDKV